MKRQSKNEYNKYLNIFYALSKYIKIQNTKHTLLCFKHVPRSILKLDSTNQYYITKQEKFMIISHIHNYEHNKHKRYIVDMVECFFDSKTSKKTMYSKPLHVHVELISNINLRQYDLLLINIDKLRNKHLYKLKQTDYAFIYHLELHKNHYIHNLIQSNLSSISKDIKKQNNELEVFKKEDSTHKKICMVVKRHNIFVLKNISNHTLVYTKISQKALKALPKFAILILNEHNEIVEVLGSILESKHDKIISMLEYGYYQKEFDANSIKQAVNIIESFSNIKGHKLPSIFSKKTFDTTLRYDLTHFAFCTIDPINAKDHDDAIYFDSIKNILYVAIADVSEYVIENSILDKEAKNRAFSLYFPNQVFPMLPPVLSSNACSLKPFTNKLAIVWEIRLHKRNANVLQSRVFKAVICSKASLNYKQVHNLIEKRIELNNLDISKSLISFYKFAKILNKNRMKYGFDFRLRDFIFKVDYYDRLKGISQSNKDSSHLLVEEAMLLANKESSKLLQSMKCGIFRNHKSPTIKDFNHLIKLLSQMGYDTKQFKKNKNKLVNNTDDFKSKRSKFMLDSLKHIQAQKNDIFSNDILDFCIVRHFSKANYMACNDGHFGLGFESYTHFTSPIRRYADLIVHRIISANLYKNDKKIKFIMDEAKLLLPHINNMELKFYAIEYFYKKLKMIRYAQDKFPFQEKVLILEVKNNIAYGIPIQHISYCDIEISLFNNNSKIIAPTIMEVLVVDVDFNSMCLKATFCNEFTK